VPLEVWSQVCGFDAGGEEAGKGFEEVRGGGVHSWRAMGRVSVFWSRLSTRGPPRPSLHPYLASLV